MHRMRRPSGDLYASLAYSKKITIVKPEKEAFA